jgi:hypothetical protein
MGIVFIPLMTVVMAIPGITNTMLEINRTALDVNALEDSILNTHFIPSNLTAGSGNVINFQISNAGTTKLWDYDHFDMLVTYDGIVGSSAKTITEKLVYTATSPTGSPITYDSTSSTNGVCIVVISCSFLHTVTTSGDNRILTVGINTASGTAIISVTYNGVALTKIRQDDNGANAHTSLWYLVNPATGTHNVQITLAEFDSMTAGSVSYTGVDQTAPIDVHNGATGISATPAVTITTTNYEDRIIDVVGTTTGPMTAGAGQVKRWEDSVALTATRGAGSDEATSTYGTYVMDWSNGAGSQRWAISAAALKPAAIVCCVPVSGWNIKSILHDSIDPRIINSNETATIVGKTTYQIAPGGKMIVTFSTDNGAKITSFVTPS